MREFFTQWRILGLWTLALSCMLTRDWLICIALGRDRLVGYAHEAIIIPVTLFSAWLLLSKPQPKKNRNRHHSDVRNF